MNAGTARPHLVVTLPGRTLPDLREEARRAARAGADWAEVRLDRLAPDERMRVGELFPTPIPLLATLRSRAEGGEGPDGPDERATERAGWLSLPFVAFDLERARDTAPASTVARADSPLWVWSRHMHTSRELVDALSLPRASASTESPAAVEKTVGPAGVQELLAGVCPRLPDPHGGPYVVHTTGPSGPLLRAWSVRLGMAMVYCAMPDEDTVPASVEASQIPVDSLVRYFRGEGGPGPLFAVVGHPVAHSLSPRLHERWMRGERRNGLYVALDMADGTELAACLPPLAERGFRGLNVTHPLKAAALETVDRPDADASACRAANTLRLGPSSTEAFNTDVVAVRRRLGELIQSGAWNGERATVLGAGGAARAALVALREGEADTRVRARREAAARELAREFGVELFGPDGSTAPALIVHATPAGRAGASEMPKSWMNDLAPGGYVLDFVYAPDDPFLRARASRHGLGYEDGFRLLVYQAAASYGLWWGRPPPDAEVNRALEEARPCAA